jgi:hypothetical protein
VVDTGLFASDINHLIPNIDLVIPVNAPTNKKHSTHYQIICIMPPPPTTTIPALQLF